MSNVRCKYIEAENCVLINVTAERILAKPGSIAYNVLDDKQHPDVFESGTLQLPEKAVVVGVFEEKGSQMTVRSTMDIDGGKAWETKVEGNAMSFEEIYDYNANVSVTTLETVIAASHDAAWNSM